MATIIVEDGSVVTGANSYITEAELTTYAADRDVTIAASDKKVLIIKSMDYLESLAYIGIKGSSTQALQFPRSRMVVDRYTLASNAIPQLVKDAQMEACIDIDRSEDPLKDREVKVIEEGLKPGMYTKFAAGSSANTVTLRIRAKLYKFLISSGNQFRVNR